MNTDNLVELRKLLDLSQEDMAKIVNVSRSTYACYESNRSVIPIERLNIISNRFNKSLNFLTGLSRTDNIKFNPIDIDKKNIGKILKRTRIKMKLTQEQLAKKLHTGVASISNYEKGRRITVLLLIDYAKVTGKSIDYLCGKTDK